MKPSPLRAAQIRRLIPHRPEQSHKGSNGHVLIVAGSRGMTGAAYLSALGALKAGAGLVTVASVEEVRKIIRARLPEAMTIAFSEIKAYVRRRKVTTLAIGPGLTAGPVIRRLVRSLLQLKRPTVLDADGLNSVTLKDLKGFPLIITPHPGEFAKLSGLGKRNIAANRLSLTQRISRNLKIVCLLKGHHTVISDGSRVSVNTTGNSAMAAGGMGDVLTGVVAALLAQGLSLFDAACAGAYVHGLAGDLAAPADRGLLSSELARAIPQAYRKLGLK